MATTEYRRRIYDRYVDAGTGDPGLARPEDAPGGLQDMLRRAIRSYFPPARDARILDLGCGYGLLIQLARAEGYTDVGGVDISPQQVAAAARLGIPGVVQADLMDTLDAQEEGSADAICCFDVLEHMTRDELIALIDAVRRVLKPGGRWIIHTANAEAPFFGRVRYGDLTHEIAFTSGSLRQVLLASGFANVECHEAGPVPRRPGGWLRWAVWRIVRLPALLWLIAESGPAARRAILSQNLFAVATR